MKILPIALSLFLVSFSSVSLLHAKENNAAQPTQMQFGHKTITHKKLDNLHHSGQLSLKEVTVEHTAIVNGQVDAKDVKVKESTTINGELIAEDSQFETLVVNGNCKLEDVEISGAANINGQAKLTDVEVKSTLNIYGQLLAKNATFKKLITANSTKIVLEKSKAKDITVQASHNTTETQQLTLKDSQVEGNIQFESGNGVITMDGHSKVEGKIEGAKVQKS